MLIRLIWRFFTGAHLDGKIRNIDGRVKPMFSDYFWNRFSRRRRALWRNLGILVSGFLTFGLFENRPMTVFCVLAFLPFALWSIMRKILNTLTSVTNYTDSDGVTEKYRVLRPKYARIIRRMKLPKWRISLPDGGPVNSEDAKVILADNAESHGEPITGLRRLQELQNNDVTDTPLSPRGRSIARKNRRRAS